MSRITKVMLKEEIRILRRDNRRLRMEVWHFKTMHNVLKGKDFCRMRAEGLLGIVTGRINGFDKSNIEELH